ncbi:MAG: thiamine phosphate synthase [Clostridia bacterium]|nr:thiamine phosphate synthase [Clostridia bacterium]
MYDGKQAFRERGGEESLYKNIIAVTNRRLCTRPFDEQLRRVCGVRPKAVILREKDLSSEEYLRLAGKAAEICGESGIPLILHTFSGAARKLGIKRIHMPLSVLRSCGADGFETVGVSVHSADEALEAERAGASYVTAGHIFATSCKPGLTPRGTELIRNIRNASDIKIYAIGGITLENLPLVMECGAAGGCIMSGMMNI